MRIDHKSPDPQTAKELRNAGLCIEPTHNEVIPCPPGSDQPARGRGTALRDK